MPNEWADENEIDGTEDDYAESMRRELQAIEEAEAEFSEQFFANVEARVTQATTLILRRELRKLMRHRRLTELRMQRRRGWLRASILLNIALLIALLIALRF